MYQLLLFVKINISLLDAPFPYNFLESSSSKCRFKIENEEQFEKHYRAMSVKIVTWAYVSYRALKYSTLNCIINC